MGNRIRIVLLAAAFAVCSFATPVAAQTPTTGPDYFISADGIQPEPQPYQPDEYMRAHVTRIITEGLDETGRGYQEVEVAIDSGSERGTTRTIRYGDIDPTTKRQKVAVGNSVIVIKIPNESGASFYISDFYRLPSIIVLAAIFFLAVLILGRWRGLTSIIGLITTVGVLFWFIIPQILAGRDPLLIVLIGAPLIIGFSMFLAHGFTKQTGLAVASTTITLFFSVFIAILAVSFTRLFGTGSEEAMFVQLSGDMALDLRGVLLAGIIIGALGVLDDITTAQTAAIHELHDAKPGMHFGELFARIMRVGREHIASLVNTLVLAYAGAAFPLFLLVYNTRTQQPLWIVLNSQQIAEEIVRTLVGSMALLLAVPISSAVAAWYYAKHPPHHG